MRLPGPLLAATLVLLAGCAAGVSPPPTAAATETRETTERPTDAATATDTPTQTETPVPTECHPPEPVANPDSITYHVGIHNGANESYEVTVTMSGQSVFETHTRTMEPRSSWRVTTVTEPGTYSLRVVTENGPKLETTIEAPFGKWPTVNDEETFVSINPNGTIDVMNVTELAAPTPVCTRRTGRAAITPGP